MKIKTAAYVAAAMIAAAEVFGGRQWAEVVLVGAFIGLIFACGILEDHLIQLRQRVEALEK